VDRFAAKRVAVNQATGIRLVVRIIFDDFTLQDADIDFIERKMIGVGFFVSVVGDPYTVVAYRVNNVFESHRQPFDIKIDSKCQPSVEFGVFVENLVHGLLEFLFRASQHFFDFLFHLFVPIAA
jgi:hypothetical protein